MEFSPRGFQRSGARPAGAAPSLDGPTASGGGLGEAPHKRAVAKLKGTKLLGLVVLIALIVGVALALGLFNKSEASLIDSKRYQAVFLSNGQVYFGKVDKLTNKYIDLSDIYYLNVQDQNVQPSSQASQNNVSLVKLGCELHSPQDRMIIYREQVTFWENLKDEGQVATAIKQWKEQNPDGQKCSTQTTQQTQTTQPTTNNSSSSNNTNTTNSTNSTNNSTNNTSNTNTNTTDTENEEDTTSTP